MAVEAAVSIEEEAAAARVVLCGILVTTGKIKWSSWRHVAVRWRAEMRDGDDQLGEG
jgi:hypothetical protein